MAKKRPARPSKYQQWRDSGWYRLAGTVVLLLLAYGFFSWAIDTGSLIRYGLGFICLGWALNNIIGLLKKRPESL